jgi:ribonuclease VapC
MSGVVLDASALLALLRNERGAATVAGHLDGALVSSVNLAEVVGHYAKLGADRADVQSMLSPLPIEVVPVNEDLAYEAGMMRPAGETSGLSLGDRICLSLAKQRNARALTADQAWKTIADQLGVEVELVR